VPAGRHAEAIELNEQALQARERILGLDQLEGGVGEDRVVAPGGEQLALALRGLLVLVGTLRTMRRVATACSAASAVAVDGTRRAGVRLREPELPETWVDDDR